MITAIQDAVLQLLPAKKKTSSSGWISFNAVCCEHTGESRDTRGRGGITKNADGGTSYHCFNCNFKTSYQPGRHLSYKFRKLLGWLGADEGTVRRLVIDAVRIKELINPDEVKPVEPEQEIVFKKRPLPDEAQSFMSLLNFYLLNDGREIPNNLNTSVDYIRNRKIDVNKYDFYWTPETQYNLHKRVIIPFTWQNEIIGYSARTFDDTVKPKYHSSYEPNYVFNIDRQHKDAKFVIVVEGPFDAMAVDGVAILSNECSETQADIVDSLGREVIVVPDADRAGSKLIDQAVEFGWTVSFPIWQREGARLCKDVAEAVEMYGKLFVIKSILAARQTTRLKIELHKKRLYN